MFRRTLAAGAFVLLSGVAAQAADLTPIMPAPVAPTVTPVTPSFGWGGLYVGAYGGYSFIPGIADAGMLAGYNFVSGNFVGGVEGRIGAGFGGPAAFYGSLNARAGFLATPNLLVYGVGGVGYIPAVTTVIYTFGGGAEYAIGNGVSVFGEARALGAIGAGCCGVSLQAGVNYHIGR